MAQGADDPLLTRLGTFSAETPAERAHVETIRVLASSKDPWRRSSTFHLTASALVVHPPTRRVLLRWHEHFEGWFQVGGHGDAGERDPLVVATREAAEETGLTDLVPWPDATLQHLAVVPVPARGDQPAHRHADLRFFLATADPDAATPERPTAPLRWLSVDEARVLSGKANLTAMIHRLSKVLEGSHPNGGA